MSGGGNWLSPWAIFDSVLSKYIWKNNDGNTPEWEFPNMSGKVNVTKAGAVSTTGTVGTYQTELLNANAGALTRTLPDATLSENLIFCFKKVDSSANAVTIAGAIEGLTSIELTSQYERVILQASGGVWYIIG
jgi:hypothetical protein